MKRLKMGMVGGGPGAFIGEVHRKAARMDGHIEVTAGAFDIDPEKSQAMGRELDLDPERVYDDYKAMLASESARSADERISFVSVTTPNNWHFPIAKAALEAGFHVMCEKPMTMTSAEAVELRDLVRESGLVFGLMHVYTGYPMVKLAREMVRQGDLGEIRKIVVQYPQGWLARAIEREGVQQASWRTDPKQSGAAGCIGDIGTHAANLAEYVAGIGITELCADLSTFVEGRPLDDDGQMLLRFDNGAKGLLHASQISIGEENNLAIRVHGENASLEWHQENPNALHVRKLNAPEEIWRRGNDYVGEKCEAAAKCTRIPFGHPEGFIESFANHYVNFAEAIRAHAEGRNPSADGSDFPSVDEGVRGMRFIEAVVKSSQDGAVWVKLEND
ncbi:Gfo/Idh/MocA family protein [Kiritimatiella glycovorans]|uniref:Putative oxidoreductase YcjS n=1 Tax=Kiritimatiella glycovorans TaxID=1307763 RepID=A0A0G3ED43_9BACT|nr:Gfo/Idh/MocA family oxidoreductase [Kiritimatiella glycovorans]AKJ64391.1 putative oxidoreductase YcjS [Kiritimatiella glycovorans]